MPYSNLILTGGINHDFSTASNALAEELMKSDIHSEVYSDLPAGLAELNRRSFDLLTVFALRWRMLDDQKYEPFREEWAYEIKERDKKMRERYAAQGYITSMQRYLRTGDWDNLYYGEYEDHLMKWKVIAPAGDK